MTPTRRTELLICLALVAATAAVYWPVRQFGFVDFDDPAVVTDNPHVRAGFTASNVRWALTGMAAGHWEPLTWWSLQADVSVWHGRPGPMHVENVLLHAAGSVALFGMLVSATGAVGRSAAAAALFAVHPMHVESVAWITERRDVLSTPLLLGSLWAYGRYARTAVRRRGWYAAFLVLYGLSLTAKATGLTMPVALLCWDAWPLRRVDWDRWRAWWPRVWEKLPVAALAGVTAAMAVAAQRASGAASTLDQVGAWARLSNAVVTPVLYVQKLAVPTGLGAFYPYPNHRPIVAVAGAGLLLVVVSWVGWRARHRRPYLLAGWGWFLVTLLPTSGLVQSGPQSMADRYSYVPSIGLGTAAVWGVADGVTPEVSAAITAVVVVAMGIVARRQVAFWSDTATLQTRMMSVAGGDAAVHQWLGTNAVKAGDVPTAERELTAAVQLDPTDPIAPFDLGNLRLRVEHDPAGAIDCYRRAAAARPDMAAAQANWGVALLQLHRPAEAYDHLRAAERLDPAAFDPHFNLGLMLLSAGRRAAAAAEFAAAVRADPSSAAARERLVEATGESR